MQVAKELIESLLWEAEGTTLDFKSAQYPFAGAPDDAKSELLKDILAFANAFRREDAFILIGAKEVKGGRAEIVGVSEQLEDSHLQQFVNSKVQRPITFAYKAIEIDGLPLGLIYIPKQKRPFHSRVNFGRVGRDVVYVRRGSSTGVASPDEIAGMGAEHVSARSEEPRLELGIVNRANGKQLGTSVEIKSIVLNGPDEEEIPDYSERSGPDYVLPLLHSVNSDFYRDLATFTRLRHLTNRITFSMTNTGDVTAQDVRLLFEIQDPDDLLTLLTEDDIPDPPQRYYDHIRASANIRSIHDRDTLHIQRIGPAWRVECQFGKIQPKDTVWLPDDLMIGSEDSSNLLLHAKILADNLGQPLTSQCAFTFSAEHRDVTLEDYADLEIERFRNTPEGQKLFKEFSEDPEGSRESHS